MSSAAISPQQPPSTEASVPARGIAIPGNWVLAFPVLWLILDQLLLWRFLGFTNPLLFIGGALLGGGVLHFLLGQTRNIAAIPLSRLLWLLPFALLILALGGEGRFFYSNIDWQVRDAVLRDMAINPWPFAYIPANGEPTLLRAPLGMFLVPALAAKQWGPVAGDLTLLGQNALLLTALLAVGSTLFASTKARLIALVTITLFSGLDVIGHIVAGDLRELHLEYWVDWLQYSSHITQAFWVPQHAFAGWLAALLILLWHRGSISIGALAAPLPLTMLWSPFALLGAAPLLLFAALSDLAGKRMRFADLVPGALTSIIALPGLIYMMADGDAVGVRIYTSPVPEYTLFMLFEVLVWAIPLGLWAALSPESKRLLRLTTVILLVCPLIQIGWSIDFMMRASIPSLAIMAVLVAEALTSDTRKAAKAVLIIILALGSVTGITEVTRTLERHATPRVTCSFYGAWDVSFDNFPKGSYLARIDQVPATVRPVNPAPYPVRDPATCWEGRWGNRR
jgi:hypothetical protein